MIIKYSSEKSKDCIFVCSSKADKNKVIKEFKGKCKFLEQEKDYLPDDTVVYGVYVGNTEPISGWLFDLLFWEDLEILNAFSK